MRTMRRVKVYIYDELCGFLVEEEKNRRYRFTYSPEYSGEPVSQTMQVNEKEFVYDSFPAFFDGLLPEGIQLDGLLSRRKIDKDDYLQQLAACGSDLVGAVSVEEDDE